MIVIGQITAERIVDREGKWAELTYKPDYYPKFPIGSAGHVLSRKAMQYIVNNLDTLVNYQGEDVSIGIWMDECEMPVQLISDTGFRNDGKCSIGVNDTQINPNLFIVGHNLQVDYMRTCWELDKQSKSDDNL